MISVLLSIMVIQVHTPLSSSAVLVKALCHLSCALGLSGGLITRATFVRLCPPALPSVFLYVRNKLRTAERICVECYFEELE